MKGFNMKQFTDANDLDAIAALLFKSKEPDPFEMEGVAIDLADAADIPEKLKGIVNGYKGRPKIHNWNVPLTSMYGKREHRIFLASKEAQGNHVNNCHCKHCKVTAAVDPDLNYASRLLHELAHSTGHKDILNRKCLTYDSRNYALEEVVAEETTRRILKHLDMMTPELQRWSDDYLAGYFDQFNHYDGIGKEEVLKEAEPYINEAVALLLSGAKKNNTERTNARPKKTTRKLTSSV